MCDKMLPMLDFITCFQFASPVALQFPPKVFQTQSDAALDVSTKSQVFVFKITVQ